MKRIEERPVLCIALVGLCLHSEAMETKYPPVGLVGHWNFNEGRGEVVHERLGWLNDMKAYGNPKWVKNQSGYCLLLDNTPHGEPVYLEIRPRRLFDQKMANGKGMYAQGAFSFWAKPIDGGSAGPNNAAFVFYVKLRISNSHWVYHVEDVEMRTAVCLNGPKVESGKWTHLAGTWNESIARLYVNGKQIHQPGGEVIVNPPKLGTGRNPYFIGLASPHSKKARYKGYLDDFRYYSRPLTPKEIEQQYETGLAKVRINEN